MAVTPPAYRSLAVCCETIVRKLVEAVLTMQMLTAGLTMPWQDLRVRWCAVVSYFMAGQSFTKAVAALKQLVQPREFEGIKNPNQFIRDNFKKFDKYHDVDNRLHSRPASHPKKVTDDMAKRCATAFKAGYMEKMPLTGAGGAIRTVDVHRYYSTIDQACKDNQVLADTIEECGVTPRHLLRRMHEVDPQLTRRTVHWRRVLTEQQKMQRRVCAAYLFFRTVLNPMLLYRTWFVDETTIWIIGTGTRSQRVYCDAHDNDVRMVLSTPHLDSHQRIKVHLFGAVNAVCGVFCDFTTGTTDIQRRHAMPNAPYKVGDHSSSHVYPCILCTCTMPGNSACMCAT